MTDRMRLTDDLIRVALTPPADGADIGLDAAVRAAVDQTAQRGYWWTPLARWFGPLGPSREMRAAGVLAALVALLLAVAAIVGTVPRTPLGDGSMFHGGPGRTGEMVGPGPVSGGSILWSVPITGPLVNTMPALDGERLFVADGRGNVGVYVAATGAKGWAQTLPRPATSPAIADGVLVLGAGDGIHALDAETGAERWYVKTEKAVASAPAIVAGQVFVGLPDGTMAAIDLQSGAVRWRTPVSGPISRAVSFGDGLAFAGGEGGAFAAVRVADGSVVWRVPLGAGDLASSAFRDGVVYTASGLDSTASHVLFALDAATGSERWHFESPGGDSLFVGAVGPDLVYAVGLDGYVYAVRDGAMIWSFDAEAPIGSVASLAGGLLYVSVSDGRIAALDASTGAMRWEVSVDGDPGPTIAAQGRLYVGTSVGILAAIAEATP
jgi:outer membrane protein assembly factor BamB